jgi:HlyD family secretion protein
LPAAAGFFLPGCQGAVEVETVPVRRGEIIDEVRVTGRVEAVEDETVRAWDTFRIEKVLVEEGDPVEVGQPLLLIDRAAREDAVQRARLNLEQAEIALQVAANKQEASDRAYSDPLELETNLRAKEAAFQQAKIERDAADRELTVALELFADGTEPSLSLDAKKDRLRAAEVALALAERDFREAEDLHAKKEKTNLNLAALRGDYEIALRQRRLAETELDLATSQLERLDGAAAVKGHVVEVAVEDGMVVLPGQEILTVADLDRLQVNAEVDELDAGKLAKGQAAIITFDAFPQMELEGRVEMISPKATIREGRAVVKTIVLLAEPTDRLKIANQVDVRIILDRRADTLKIPLRAVRQEDRPFVWVYDNGRARKRIVQTGLSDLEQIEVLDGLAAGDEVILSRVATLHEGERVKR